LIKRAWRLTPRLVRRLAQEGLKYLSAGMNPMDLKRGIDHAVEVVVAERASLARLVERRHLSKGDASLFGSNLKEIPMKSDAQLQKDILAELKWDPIVNETDVGVIVKDGVVTLTGHLASYAEKCAVERAAQRVHGVKALAIELSVKLPGPNERTDAQIAAAAENAIEWNSLVPQDKVRPTVERGWITLNGEVEWDYQRRAAEKSLRNLLGVTGVTNLVHVKPRVSASQIDRKIHDALLRQAARESRRIDVSVSGSQVTLEGTVHSWAERVAAQGVAFAAPGVSTVVNHLHIGS
jgi:osmotically-inducible protein OsmY